MSTKGTRSWIHERIGQVTCSPPALEYKSDKCKGLATYVCHHCKSPLCENCAYVIPDKDFPVFSEVEGKDGLRLYASIIARVVAAVILFPLAYVIGSLFNFSEYSFDLISMSLQTVSFALPTVIVSVNFLLIIAIALLLSAIVIPSTIYVRKEETPSGKKELKVYDKKNLTAAHCEYCLEKHHKSKKTKRIAQIVAGALILGALLIVVQGYVSGLMELAFPITLVLVASSALKIVHLTEEKEIISTV